VATAMFFHLDSLAVLIYCVNLEKSLRQVNPNRANFHLGRSHLFGELFGT